MKSLISKLFLLVNLIVISSCSTNQKMIVDDPVFVDGDNYDYDKKFSVRCTENSKPVIYEIGDTPCWKSNLRVNSIEILKIQLKVINRNSEDLYERGYQKLSRIKNGKIIEEMKLRRDDDAYWSEVPFVRVRKQKYLADLDGDGFQEFAIFPFSSGSAIWGTVRIYSLKDKIEFWGEGRYQFEGDSFVQLGCMNCSKFNPKACVKCR